MDMTALAALITAFGALVGVGVTVWKHLNQQEMDNLRRLDEKFTSIVSNLCSDNPAVQASALVSILGFLKYRAFKEQVYLTLLTHLKFQQTNEAVSHLLVSSFARAIRKWQSRRGPHDIQERLDLSHTNLFRIDLSNLDLTGADLGFTNLQYANLTGTKLSRAKGWKAKLDNARLSRANLHEARFKKAHFKYCQFHDALLTSARLEETDLRGAEFYNASLQSAHLDGANLEGALFDQANLNDTYFKGIKVTNKKTLKSLSNAKNWRKAHFDEELREKLEEISPGT
jgi:uncharacterized protein YjbI with pentapeptide repeats